LHFIKASKKSSGNGPGKALRQENSLSSISSTSQYHQDSFESDNKNSLENLSTTLKTASISSKTYNSNIIESNNNTNNGSLQALVTVTASTTSSLNNATTINTTISSMKTESNTNRTYSNANEDLMKMEKFKTILAANPVNLEELQKASWKGIPKCFRPICWKLLSVGFLV
jgi:hypothetical protein